MRVALICIDKEASLEIRKANREAHLAYIAATGVVEMAGPFLTETGDMAGSLVVLDVADLQAARDWAEADPYAKAGLFHSVDIREWKKVIG
ncbi:YciI family protein [Xinfangfangia sp. CPCC 101601]|uniref:YciI family protein n=1 Tax=Pseudogemmobacter lacusdianii TaxID=3069608 RepID=A0ABU0VU14_9RHOB|nr:YciI family protein [Xinfangfangia sp. CPCC 101601]MDQ2065214.1 YciI family protein [Xinfangfangia sp. CPCC 101601]